MSSFITNSVIKGVIKTMDPENNQDVVENTIDAIFEPVDSVINFIDSIFDW